MMSSETSLDPEIAAAESKMRRSLGLEAASTPASVPSSPTDPLKGARQAIRSQAAAREYVERQLAHAETTINDVRAKLHHARREKDTAVDAARAALASKIVAERNLMATEAALSEQTTNRECRDRALRESQAMIKELERRLEAARQTLQTTQAELAAERQARLKAKEVVKAVTTTPEPTAPADQGDGALRPVPRRPGSVRGEASTPVIVDFAPTKPTTRKPPSKAGRSPATKPVKWWVKGQ